MIFNKLKNKWSKNKFDHFLKQAALRGETKFLILWNRGLGDISLGLYGLVHKIRQYIPQASVTFVTRKELQETFFMLDSVRVIVDTSVSRGEAINFEQVLKNNGLSPNMFDIILQKPDPTNWLKDQINTLTPKLYWDSKWDLYSGKYNLKGKYIGVHIQTETGKFYGYEKNWDLPSWRDLFKKLGEQSKEKILLFGHKPDPAFLMENVIDLRGKTSFLEMMSVIKNKCFCLVAPDSGVLSIVYYIDMNFPLRVVSLWADPQQGVLKHNVSSPNKKLQHIPLCGKDQKVSNITIDSVLEAIF